MRKFLFILSFLLIACMLGSSTFSIASAAEYYNTESEILDEEEPIESEIETENNPSELSKKRPKLSTLDLP